MCRNITTLRGLEPEATPEEIEAAARQYVRKISGVQKTSDKTAAAFEKAVRRITLASEELLAQLPPRQQPPKTEPPLRRIAAPRRGVVPRLALLLAANSNRVYGEAAFGLAEAELRLLDEQVLGGIVGVVAHEDVAGVAYLVAETHEPLDDARLDVLGNLSSLHALYLVEADGRFRPLRCTPRRVLDEDLLTIQRYAGKTNEAFTHLLVNLALASSARGFERVLAGERLRLLDPTCGRGTTLNRAAAYGMDAIGVEADGRDVEAYATFLLTWLKDKRIKHTVDKATLRKGRVAPAHRFTVTYGAAKPVDQRRIVDLVHDDTLRSLDHVKARSIDLLACDLPYGVQHGSQPGPGRLDRGPAALLEEALPAWFELLRPGAAAAFAWNRRTLPRGLLADLAIGAGFTVERKEEDAFVHRVDRAITRDVLVAVRPER